MKRSTWIWLILMFVAGNGLNMTLKRRSELVKKMLLTLVFAVCAVGMFAQSDVMEKDYNHISDNNKMRLHGYSALLTVETWMKPGAVEQPSTPIQLEVYEYEIWWFQHHFSSQYEGTAYGPRCMTAQQWLQQRQLMWTPEHPPAPPQPDPLEKQ